MAAQSDPLLPVVSAVEWVPEHGQTDVPDDVWRALEPLDGYGPAGTRGGPRPYRYRNWWVVIGLSDFGDVFVSQFGPYQSDEQERVTPND